MKINLPIHFNWYKIMKITMSQFIIALVFTGISYAENSIAQSVLSRPVNISADGNSLSLVLKKLEKNANVKFVYSKDLIKVDQKISIQADHEKLGSVLDKLFKANGVSYEAFNDRVVLSNSVSSAVIISITENNTGAVVEEVEKIAVKGAVTDEKGEPLIGVSVKIKGTNIGVSTNGNGQFALNASSEQDILIFTYIGYATLEVPINKRITINVVLKSDSKSLSEVIIVGYGVQKKATLTGAVSQIKGSEIAQSPSTNVSNGLAGRLAGLVAVTPSSEPGADGSVLRIRGINTMNNNSPLVVVDGIPGRSLERIDPSTIESISVLKDASAAIYGAQAANGVILVTTKRGKVGKPTITASFNQGFGTPTKLPEMADAPTYATMINEIAYYKNPTGYTPVYSNVQIEKFANGSDPWNYPNTDWFKEVLQPWAGQNYGNLSVNGGSESVKYLVSLSSKQQGGFYYNSGTKYKQYDFRTNLDGKINKNISLAFDVAGRMEDRNFPTRSAGSIFRMVMRGKPTMTAYWPDGTPGPDIEFGDNPVVVSTKATGYDRDKRYVVNSNMRLNVKVPWVSGLSLTGNAAIDKDFRLQKTWQTPWYLYSFSGFDANNQPILEKSKKGFDSPALNERMEDNQNILINGLVNYETTFLKNNDFKFLIGVEKITGRGDNFSGYRKNFTSSTLDQMFAGATDQFMSNDGSSSDRARLNYFGRVNYAFKEKYLAEFVWRYQGSYIFPSDKRFGFFPGISVGYNISEEKFWKDNLSNTINSLKIRGSWGQTGNDQINEWQYLATYDLGGIRPNSWNPRMPYITNGSVENPALFQTVLPNPNVTWEIANQSNIGIDATFLKDKLSVTADYFNYTRSDILWNRNASVPTSSGLSGMLPKENIGKMANKGFDFSVAYNNKFGELSYQAGINGGYQKNKIIYWDEPSGAPGYQQTTGHPYRSQLWYNATGIFHNQAEIDSYPHWSGAVPGDVKFEDYNKDGKIDAFDRKMYDKSENPTFQGGFNLSLGYKGFDLSALLQGSAGAVRYISNESGEIGNYTNSFAEGRWTPQNPNADKPRTFNRSNEYWVAQGNTFWVRKSDYLRLKNIELGYKLPKLFLSRVGIQNLRVYVNAYNLLTYAPDMEDFDPELSSSADNGTNTNVSTGGQGYPLQKIINGGLSLTF